MNNFIENMLACCQPSLPMIIQVLVNIPIAISTTVTPVQIKTFFPILLRPIRLFPNKKSRPTRINAETTRRKGATYHPISQKEDFTQ
jgi:hypothetical protein